MYKMYKIEASQPPTGLQIYLLYIFIHFQRFLYMFYTFLYISNVLATFLKPGYKNIEILQKKCMVLRKILPEHRKCIKMYKNV